MKSRIFEWLTEKFVYLAGTIVVLIVFVMFYYLSHEARYAFDRTFAYGFNFAAQPLKLQPDPYTGEIPDDLSLDPYASQIKAHFDGDDGLDEKEEVFPMPTLGELEGFARMATGTALVGEIDKIDPENLYKDDWREPKHADVGEKYLLFLFATPEHDEDTMVLAWEPEANFQVTDSPYAIKLRLLQKPEGVNVPDIEVDLVKRPKGRIELPTWIATSDEERLNGYVFQIETIPRQSNFTAVLKSFFTPNWNPTLYYPQFGFIPLLLGTLIMAGIAMLIAMPIGIASATYLSEIASSRLREWLKPIIELLASVPTVVLGYFGLMIVAPGLMKLLSEAIGMESGRSMLTAALVLGFLLLPTIITLTEDAFRSLPQNLRDGADALGLTMREKIRMVLVPAAKAGMVGAALLAFARAIGETMVIWILSGGTATMPSSPLKTLVSPSRGLPDTIAIEMGNVEFEGVHYGHLFLIGLILFSITLAVNLTGYYIAKRNTWQNN